MVDVERFVLLGAGLRPRLRDSCYSARAFGPGCGIDSERELARSTSFSAVRATSGAAPRRLAPCPRVHAATMAWNSGLSNRNAHHHDPDRPLSDARAARHTLHIQAPAR